eukprot:540734_1
MASDCCQTCIHDCIKRINNPYFCILMSGIIYGVAISSLYTWMSNVNQVEVSPFNEYSIFSYERLVFQSQGIICLGTDQSYCNQMTQEMVNITSMNSSKTVWQCASYTDYSHKSLFDDISHFRTMFILFIICTALSAIFSIIHDWTLVYYRYELDKLTSYPHIEEHGFTFLCKIAESVMNAQQNHCQSPNWFKCLSLCFWIPVYIITFIILAVLMALQFPCIMMLYPFWVLTIKRSCYGFSYVSSMWVGISTGLMMLFAVILLFDTGGWNSTIPSMDAKCTCSCSFILIKQDLWSFIIVAFGLVLVNAKFLYYWYKESKHGEQFLYLVKYLVPLFRARNINKDNNPVGSMFEGRDHPQHGQLIAMLEANVNTLLVNTGNDDSEQKANINTFTTSHQYCRCMWIGCVTIISWIFLAIIIMIFGGNNVYDYAQWIAIVIFTVGAILCLLCYVFICAMVYDD